MMFPPGQQYTADKTAQFREEAIARRRHLRDLRAFEHADGTRPGSWFSRLRPRGRRESAPLAKVGQLSAKLDRSSNR